jgi:hypothetical protein
MKTQIITLESHDDLISVRDRLSWAKTPRILLVWPKYEKVTLRQVDLKVLQRHAASLGAQLGLVTRARRVRDDAEALNIPVFESTGQAQRVAWPKPPRKRFKWHAPRKDLREQREQALAGEERWRANPVVRVLSFLVGVSAVLTLVALFIPRAQITLNPISKTQSLILPVTASTSVDSVFITGSIPAREKRVIVDGTQTITVTGTATVPQAKATGTVVFRNLSKKAVSVPGGTTVQNAAGVQFITTKDGQVKAGTGKTLELPIEAVNAGVAGNLDADTINVIETSLKPSLAVTNPKPTTGGRESSSVQASDADRERVKSLLMKSLEEAARKKWTGELSPGDLLFDQTMKVTQTISEVYNPPAGAASTRLTLTMQVEFSILYASAPDLSRLASLALNASLPSGFSASSQAIRVTPATTPTLDEDGSAKWSIRVDRKIVQHIDTRQVTQMIQGFGAWNVESRLKESLPLASAPTVQLTPSWWPWMPILPFRIAVVTE